jgi:hypothetical protein
VQTFFPNDWERLFLGFRGARVSPAVYLSLNVKTAGKMPAPRETAQGQFHTARLF